MSTFPLNASEPRCSVCTPGVSLSMARARAKQLHDLCCTHRPLSVGSCSALRFSPPAPAAVSRHADKLLRVTVFSSISAGLSLPKLPSTSPATVPAHVSANAMGISSAEVKAAVPGAFVDSAGGVSGLLLWGFFCFVFFSSFFPQQQTNSISIFPPHSRRFH